MIQLQWTIRQERRNADTLVAQSLESVGNMGSTRIYGQEKWIPD